MHGATLRTAHRSWWLPGRGATPRAWPEQDTTQSRPGRRGTRVTWPGSSEATRAVRERVRVTASCPRSWRGWWWWCGGAAALLWRGAVQWRGALLVCTKVTTRPPPPPPPPPLPPPPPAPAATGRGASREISLTTVCYNYGFLLLPGSTREGDP